MSNPAIVLLTDPSRCGQGDVHYLVQALLEIQQMGEHATPQAFCDHPAAAREFMTAYTHAYPKLVLQSQEIPTPDHLEALITTGQVGPLGRPDVDSFDESWRPPGENGLNAFPLVVLTLGSPQVLLDALRQNHLMKENISLIDIVPDGTSDIGPVSIAEAVAIRGRGADGPGEDTGPGGSPPALDEVASASATETSDFILRDDQIGLDTVEPVEAPPSVAQAYDGNGQKGPDEFEPSSPAAPPQPVVENGQAAPAAGPQDSAGGAGAIPSAEPAVEAPAQAQPAWPTDSGLIPPSTPPAPVDVVADDGVADDGVPDDGALDDGDEEQPDDAHPDGEKPEQPHSDGKDDDDGSADAHGRDEDVHYEPVGSLRAEADVLYPAADHVEAPATLRELAAALADDGIFDTDPTSEIPSEPQDGRDSDSTSAESILSHTSNDHGVTFEDLYDSVDADTEDASDTDVHHPLHHESDL